MNLALFVIVPLACVFLIVLLARRFKALSDILANTAALFLLLLACFSLKQVAAQGVLTYNISGWAPPIGIALVMDGLSAFMLLTVNLVAFLAMIYAISYMRRYTEKWKFHALFLMMLTGMNGVILSGDLFNLYIFIEVASISGYALVAFGTQAEDLEAAFKYAIMGALASIFVLLGIALLYSHTSTLNMADIALSLAAKPRGILINFISVLFLAGFGLKAAIVPFHAWLPDAHSSAPSPVSAVLSGVFIKTLGVYALARVFFNIIGISAQLFYVLMILGILSMAIGAFLAVAQNDIKRMFAYSSISQVGYIIFALGIASPLAIFGALLHLFNHAVLKSLLFLNAGTIEYATDTRSLKGLGGLNDKLPVASVSSLVASMSISGIPPLGGFWSKLIIIIAAVQAGYFNFALVAVLVSVVTLVYYLKFYNTVFLGSLNAAIAEVKAVPFTMKFSLVALAIISLIAGGVLLPGLRIYLQAAANVLMR
ncbi:MAG: proton-conducting transporter membrane subunit [Candidatus Omnitrophica bacterium]|nr:proton-conducting transporter membrane subunit [Candidatus Omnitrophota bacterium]MDD5653140.1 proton-conducting transporter membrane subunit [Candidatus Omnitrophota bacterium]